MKELINPSIFERFLGSLDNQKNKGFSGRKMTAFALVCVVVAIHFKWIALGDFSQLIPVLVTDYAFIASLFGMTTYQSMKEHPSTLTSTMKEDKDGIVNETTLEEKKV
jgi:hypothetical protein